MSLLRIAGCASIFAFMLTDKLKQLASLKAKTAQLEAQVRAEQQKELAALPAKFGFGGPDDFIAAFRAATGKRDRPSSTRGGAKSGGSVRRRRANITDETRSQVKKLVAGGRTGTEIATALGISLPSVQNIKKALGLVKKHKK